MSDPQPQAGTIERWAWDFVLSTTLSSKLVPPQVPAVWEERPCVRRIGSPGRPPELSPTRTSPKTRGLGSPKGRARALHTFFHHELQAAELMAWAVLAFPQMPLEFRAGLVRIALDETRHMRMYAEHIERLGFGVGAFAVRDWFWDRVPTCPTPLSFVAVMGLGFEGANLEHATSFAQRFRDAGDEEGARIQETVGREELAHVRFGAKWFRALTGGLDFDRWREELPRPLTPTVMHGWPLRRDLRASAGLPEPFLDRLQAWDAPTPGS